MGILMRLINTVRGFTEEQKTLLEFAEDKLDTDDYRLLKRYAREDRQALRPKTLNVPGVSVTYPSIKGDERLNQKIREAAYEHAFDGFSQNAFDAITYAIAPNILDMEHVKQASCLQLFAKERMHILLLGDPGTGKTEILRSASHLAPKASMGLGSGTSGAGLSATYAGGELDLGLLPLADKGLCCIDELNLMKKEDRAALYNAMEKGFVTYDKGGRHEQFPADVRVLATANPKGDRFKGADVEALKEQLPFDPALLSRFHMVFLVRKPDVDQFAKIAKKIARDEKRGVKHDTFHNAYIKRAHLIGEVSFPAALEKRVTKAARTIKEHEEELLVEVSPRVVKGIIGFAKASARCELRETVEEKDVERALTILGDSLGLKL